MIKYTQKYKTILKEEKRREPATGEGAMLRSANVLQLSVVLLRAQNSGLAAATEAEADAEAEATAVPRDRRVGGRQY